MSHTQRPQDRPIHRSVEGEPLYEGLKKLIRTRIDSGEWPPRFRVPSENELVAETGVSRMTANRALRELAQEGFLVRVQGSGSFVAERKGHSALVEVHNIADEIRRRGNLHRSDILLLKAESASPDIAEALGLALGADVFHSLTVHYENDVPVQIEDRWVNPMAAPHYLSQDFTIATPYGYLATVSPLSGGEHLVEAVLPQAWECKLLAIARTEPCLQMMRRTWSGIGPITKARLLYPGSRYRLEGRFGRELPA